MQGCSENILTWLQYPGISFISTADHITPGDKSRLKRRKPSAAEQNTADAPSSWRPDELNTFFSSFFSKTSTIVPVVPFPNPLRRHLLSWSAIRDSFCCSSNQSKTPFWTPYRSSTEPTATWTMLSALASTSYFSKWTHPLLVDFISACSAFLPNCLQTKLLQLQVPWPAPICQWTGLVSNPNPFHVSSQIQQRSSCMWAFYCVDANVH